MNTVRTDLSVMGGGAGGLLDVSPVVSRTMSSSLLEVGATTSSSMMEKRAHSRSKSVTWNEPMLLLERITSRRVPGFSASQRVAARGYRKQSSKGSTTTATKQFSQEVHRPSKWVRFWRRLRLDGGKQVHAARPDWLKYDAQSYAMNFEKDVETPYRSHSQPMPKVSGPGAREIVTVLLRRSSSANRNSGSILIPKPVFDVPKQETNAPLWKRRSVQAPSSLTVRLRGAPSIRKRSNAA